MMKPNLNDVHHQFASFFTNSRLRPYAYLLSKKLSEGHICLHLDSLEEELDSLPAGLKEGLAREEELPGEEQVGLGMSQRQPFILDGRRLYLHRYFAYETLILERILAFVQAGAGYRSERMALLRQHAGLIRTLFSSTEQGPLPYPDWQLAAALSAVLNQFTIITGGPGTGKTTTIAKVLAMLFATHPQLSVSLAAPTGKAAARMAESLKSARLEVDESIRERFRTLEPSTIHRLLKTQRDSLYFKHHAGNPLPYDVIIIDESSMIDVALFAKLLDAVGPDTRLILLGDKDQLASVEAGSLFGDLCQSQEKLNVFSAERLELINSLMDPAFDPLGEKYGSSDNNHPLFEHLVELRISHRFKGEEEIGRISRAVIQNEQESLSRFLDSPEAAQVHFDPFYSAELFERFINGYREYIAEKDIALALKKLNQLRVLCAIREGEQGLYHINRRIEKLLNEKKLISLKGEFYEHRPVMVSSNNYALELYNGDIGIVRPDEQGVLKVWFENAQGPPRPVLPGLLSQVETVFAMTIHKSQGSEFDRVLLVLPANTGVEILTRELLYTGITRAKSEVYIQSSKDQVLQTAARRVQRASGISQRFLSLSQSNYGLPTESI